jgi:DNA-binding response OmpR family regulator
MEKILVVDDDQDIRELVIFTLQLAGYEIYSAMNGEEALRICKEQTPDLVLLDVRLPGISGYELCQQIKSDPALERTTVVFLTAKGQVDEIRRGLEAGAADYFLKPFKPEELTARVKEVLLYNT